MKYVWEPSPALPQKAQNPHSWVRPADSRLGIWTAYASFYRGAA